MAAAAGSRAALLATTRRLARLAVLGIVLGAGGVLALVAAGRNARVVSAIVFSLAALVFGFGLSAWAGTLLLGESFERVHAMLDVDADWTAADSRQAMAVLAAVGGGAMVGVVAVTVLLGL